MYRSHSEVIILPLINTRRCRGGIPDACLSQANVDDRSESREHRRQAVGVSGVPSSSSDVSITAWEPRRCTGAHAINRPDNTGSLRASAAPEERLGSKGSTVDSQSVPVVGINQIHVLGEG